MLPTGQMYHDIALPASRTFRAGGGVKELDEHMPE